MKPPIEKVLLRRGFARVQIDVTNKCFNKCIYCDRYERHLREDMLWEMDLDMIEYAIDCCLDMPIAMIGIIGGEPQMHSKFKQICSLVRSKTPYGKIALYTSIDPNKSKYKADIMETFRYIPLNPHNSEQLRTCQHQPLTLAVKDMVTDKKLREELIDKCWIGDHWCFSIAPSGIYHCEIGYGLAALQGIKGWPIEKGWWKRETMEDQLHICQLCGGCIPMEKQYLCQTAQKISPSFLEMLKKHNLPIGEYELVPYAFPKSYMAHWAKTWRPDQYRNETIEEAEAIGAFLGNRVDWSKWK